MAVLRRLDAAAVRRWCAAALTDLRARRQEIDDLNVYPVPDGDAGTNMVATMEAVHTSLLGARGDDLAVTMKALARGALVGARGNSGVILSQVLGGFAEVLGPLRSAGGEKLKEALDAAVHKAYAAVSHPAEGTILTVAKGAAQAARAVEGDDFAAVIRAAAAGAREALEATTEQLPALKAAGVVDAGGRGLVVVLEALAKVMGAGVPEGALSMPPAVPRNLTALVGAREAGSPEFAYEVQFLLDATDDVLPVLKDALSALGDSLVVVGSDGLYNVHVHVNDVGATLGAAFVAGVAHNVVVTRFAEQIAAQEARASRPIFAGAAASGLHGLFAGAGAIAVPTSSQRDQLAEVIASVGVGDVIVLPNCPELLAVATGLAADGRVALNIIPTTSAVQGLAALAVHDVDRPLADDVSAMTAAAVGTRAARVRADAGELDEVALAILVELITDDDELVTLLAGESVSDEALQALVGRVETRFPRLEVEAYRGDQTGDALLIGVE
ncbi:MAG: DAK2 domain-containing protein [Mycobacteriales bacterium]